MHLYHLSQSVNNEYDTYSDCVVAAESDEDAVTIHPGTIRAEYEYELQNGAWRYRYHGYPWSEDDSWALPQDVEVQHVGYAVQGIERGVICASFHAG